MVFVLRGQFFFNYIYLRYVKIIMLQRIAE